MADVNRGDRPLSPHLMIYNLPLNAVLSITHRITGTALAFSALLIVWWFLAAATSPQYFAFADGLLTSWVGTAILVLSAFGLWFHFCNGIRHLIWDLGYGFDVEDVERSCWIVLGASVVLTLLTLILA